MFIFMCGRFAHTKELSMLMSRFNFIVSNWVIRQHHNIAPGEDCSIIVQKDQNRTLKNLRWGLIPRWAKPNAPTKPLINARAETLAEKPSFKQAFAARRCLVPADGFYEWQKLEGGKRKKPFLFALKNREPFAFAGIWEEWQPAPDAPPLQTFAIITTSANELVAPIHDRMPVILKPECESLWLDPRVSDPRRLLPLLAPYPSGEMERADAAI